MNTATVANRCFTVCRLSGIGPMKETGMNDVIIRHDGTVTMSGLVKADFGCSLNFKRFPFDTQLCKFYFGTLSLTNNEIQFNNTAINMAHSTISQGNSVYNITQIRVRNKIKSVPIAMYICMRLWIKYNPTTRLPDYPTTRLPDYPTTRLPDYPTTRLPDCSTARLPREVTSNVSILAPDHPSCSMLFSLSKDTLLYANKAHMPLIHIFGFPIFYVTCTLVQVSYIAV